MSNYHRHYQIHQSLMLQLLKYLVIQNGLILIVPMIIRQIIVLQFQVVKVEIIMFMVQLEVLVHLILIVFIYILKRTEVIIYLMELEMNLEKLQKLII